MLNTLLKLVHAEHKEGYIDVVQYALFLRYTSVCSSSVRSASEFVFSAIEVLNLRFFKYTEDLRLIVEIFRTPNVLPELLLRSTVNIICQPPQVP